MISPQTQRSNQVQEMPAKINISLDATTHWTCPSNNKKNKKKEKERENLKEGSTTTMVVTREERNERRRRRRRGSWDAHGEFRDRERETEREKRENIHSDAVDP